MVKLIQSLHILPRWIILLIDLSILAFSLILAYFIRFDFQIERFLTTNISQGLPIFLICNLIAIFLTQSYSGIIRHTGLQDGYRIAYTTTLGVVFTLVINYIYLNMVGSNVIPLGVVTMAYLNSLIFLIGYRILVKYIFSYYKHAVHRKANVVIFGAGKTGQLTKQIFDSDYSVSGRPVAFIEDNPRIVGKVINGIRIFSARNNLDKLMKELKVSELIIATPNLSLERKNEVVDFCLKNNIKVRSIPPADQWIRGELSFNQIKDIKIEDLLGRESIKLDSINIIREIKGKKVFISGSAGSIGAELVRQVLSYHPSSITMFDQAESATFELLNELSIDLGDTAIHPFIGDITDMKRVEDVIRKVQPDIIFHAAAYKHVPLMEDNPLEAAKCNIVGTKYLADLAVKYGVGRFVMISTDKAVNPTSVMGATKRIAEIYVQSLHNYLLEQRGPNTTSFITTRFGNVLGSNGSVIPLFKKQIKKRAPITVTHPNVTRYFMTIPEACQLVLEAGSMGRGGEIYIFDMGKSIKIVDLAKKMVQLSGLELNKDIELKFTGLRPGEKLFEELLNNKENTIPTHHPKIMIANVQKAEYSLIQEYFQQIQEYLELNDEAALVELMKIIVPEYVSNASKFQKFDQRDTTISSSTSKIV